MAEEAMVHPRAAKRRVRLAYGGRARSLRGALRSETSGGLLRRDALPDGGRNVHPHTCKARASGALRLDTNAGGWSTSSLCSRRRPAGGTWTSPSGARRWTSPMPCVVWPRSTTPRPRRCGWFSTTSTLILPPRSYKAFEPEEARRVLRRLEFHHTPKHASWLNQVEIELSALSRQCLRRRIRTRAH